MEKPDGLPNI